MFHGCFLDKRNAEHGQKHVPLEARLRCSGFIREDSTRIRVRRSAIGVFIGARMDWYCTADPDWVTCRCHMVQAPSFLRARTWVVGSIHHTHSSVGMDREHPILCAGWSAGGRL